MSRSKAVQDLARTLDIMQRYENHTPPEPEAGRFYMTYNGSVVYVFQVDDDGEARAVILKGGAGHEQPGDVYFLSEDGYHREEEAGPHLVLALREQLNIELPGD